MRDRWVLFWHIFGFTAFFTLIGLLISLLAEPRSTRVPEVTGIAEGPAVAAIADASLRVGNITRVCSDSVAMGLIISQDPVAGARVRRNSTVNLTVSSGACTVAVPDVTGLTRAEAETALANAGLTTGSVTSTCSNTVPAGTVIAQTPAGATRESPGTAVNLVVSSGLCPVTVPALAGLARADAIAAILATGLNVGNLHEQCDDAVAADAVITQDPVAGTQVAPGTAVSLTVSTGLCPVTVPDVTGLEQAAAEMAITQAGFSVGESTLTCSDVVPQGAVITQDPVAGTQVAPGTAVSLTVSTGPCPVTVPDVTGLEQAEAETTITQAGLSVGESTLICSDIVPQGAVITQDPVAGTQVAPGAAVSLTVSTGPCPVTVPDVTGLEQAAATSILTAAGLYSGTVTFECDNLVSAGAVTRQQPAAGTQVAPGSTVDIVVSTGQPIVPDVLGLELAQADTAISAVTGLSVNFTFSCSDTVPLGLVANQNPAGGTTVSCGTVVEVVLSTGVCPVTVPDVTGQELAAAVAALEEASLLYTAVEGCSNSVPAGSVAEQDPAGGEAVPPGSVVALVVSNGPCPVEVPDVLGQELSVALEALSQASLVYVVTQDCSDSVPADHVAAQDPAGGTLVLPGSLVTLTVSTGMCVEIPDVTGQTLLQAALTLDQAGLTLGTQTQECDGSVPQGHVRAQSPAAGTRVMAGTAVSLSVSTGPCPPPNDLCENAYPLLTGVTTYGTLFNATPTENISWSFADIYDVWYVWIPERDGNAVMTTCGPGTTFDTVLRVFDTCQNLFQYTSNEDSDFCDNPQHSRLTYSVRAGTPYLIRVSGYAQTFGLFQIEVFFEE